MKTVFLMIIGCVFGHVLACSTALGTPPGRPLLQEEFSGPVERVDNPVIGEIAEGLRFEVEFKTLPSPGTVCEASVRLTIDSEKPLSHRQSTDWLLMLESNPNLVHIHTDTVIRWSGAKEVGGVFSFTLQFTPLQSGSVAIGIKKVLATTPEPVRGGIMTRGGILWCLTPQGELDFLIPYGGPRPSKLSAHFPFFNSDSLVVRNFNMHNRRSGFASFRKLIISPTPLVGEKSKLTVVMDVYEELLQDVALGVQEVNLALAPCRDFWNHEGDSVIICFWITPSDIPLLQGFSINVSQTAANHAPAREEISIGLNMLFKPSGELAGAGRDDMSHMVTEIHGRSAVEAESEKRRFVVPIPMDAHWKE